MKTKIFSIVLVLSIIVSFVGCGDDKPKDISTGNYNIAKKAIEVSDKYIDMDITYDEAHEIIEDLKSRTEDGTAQDLLVSTYVFSLYLDINQNHRGFNTIDDVIESRNNLAESIGMKKRKVSSSEDKDTLQTIKNKETTSEVSDSNTEYIVYPLSIESKLYDRATKMPDIIYTTPASENGLKGNAYFVSGTVTDVVSLEDSNYGMGYFIVENERGKIIFLDMSNSSNISESSYIEKAAFKKAYCSGYDNTIPQIDEKITVYGLYFGYSNVLESPVFYFGLNENLSEHMISEAKSEMSNVKETETETISEIETTIEATDISDEYIVYPLSIESKLYDYATEIPDILYTKSASENDFKGKPYYVSGTVTNVVNFEDCELGITFFIVENEKGNAIFADIMRSSFVEEISDEEKEEFKKVYCSGYDNTLPKIGEKITAYGLFFEYSTGDNCPVFYFGLNENTRDGLILNFKDEETVDKDIEMSELFRDIYMPYAKREKSFIFSFVKSNIQSTGYKFEITEPTNRDLGTIKISDSSGDYVFICFTPINKLETIMSVSYYQISTNSEVIFSNYSSNGSPQYDTFETHKLGESSVEVSNLEEQIQFLFAENN